MQIANSSVTNLSAESQLLPMIIAAALGEGNALAMWKMPNSNEKHLLVCTNGVKQIADISLEETATGFVFSPFDNTKEKLFFNGNIIHTFKDGFLEANSLTDSYLKVHSKNSDHQVEHNSFYVKKISSSGFIEHDYLQLVKKGIDEISKGSFEKIVPSRFKKIDLASEFDLLKTFQSLCVRYPNALVSLVSSPETGTWLGATPELLVSIDRQSRFKTVALAGTKRFSPDMDIKSVAWTEKEIEEQAMVSRYIINCFKKIRLREYEEHGPRTAVAGNLLHLKTEYEVDMKATNFPQLGSVMLKLLHPTSAVCGMPLDSALTFLTNNEGYDRQFYSGYLGPVNFRNESHIFVNLRCMQIHDQQATLYAGAGVTIDSIPEKELEETEIKMETLQQVLTNVSQSK